MWVEGERQRGKHEKPKEAVVVRAEDRGQPGTIQAKNGYCEAGVKFE
jgi:hypothetical protein